MAWRNARPNSLAFIRFLLRDYSSVVCKSPIQLVCEMATFELTKRVNLLTSYRIVTGVLRSLEVCLKIIVLVIDSI